MSPTRAPVIEVYVHEATRSGSVRVLLDLLDIATEHEVAEFRVISISGGALAGEMTQRTTAAPHRAADAVWINSAVTLEHLPEWVARSELPVLCFVHEDEEGLAVLSPSAVTLLVERCDRVWCVSEGVKSQVERLGVPRERAAVVPPVISASAAPHATRAGLSPMFVGCGTATWHKGPDLFVDVARRIRQEIGDARFAWVGARPRQWARVLTYDAAELGLAESLRWCGEVDDPMPILAEASLVLSTSRREAWPVVPMEAAMAGTATAAFAVGGFVEMGELGCVETVPYPDTAALADAAIRLWRDPERRRALVRNTREHLAAHQSPEALTPVVIGLLQDLCKSRRR